ncbi:hypothetical protein Hypma_010468 [Hypsizygus marmoreus]|uniref:Uncharacterized protein n=1 Tax=Hypsizygus marmoreus TaxID=39966 RepID=A0A369JSQ2_HYPMA|nr:hypothetical protein Hypma_010468 [Hypsizygus marmoreus]
MDVVGPMQFSPYASTSQSAALPSRMCAQGRCTEILPPTYPGSVCERCIHESRTKKRKRRGADEVVDRPLYTSAAFGTSLRSDRKVSEGGPPQAHAFNSHGPPVVVPQNPYPSVNIRRHSAPSRTSSYVVPSQFPSRRPAMMIPQPTYQIMPTVASVPHFNSKGELIQPSSLPPVPVVVPQTSTLARLVPSSTLGTNRPPTHSMRPRHNLRLCAQYGCGAILSSKSLSDICPRCCEVQLKLSNQAAQLPIVVPSLSEEYSMKLSNGRNLTPPGLTNTVNSSVNVGPDQDINDIQLLYPESIEPSTTPQPVAAIQKPLLPHRVRPSQAPVTTFRPTRHNRICASSGCNTVLQPDSTTTRCFNCIMKDWKSRVNQDASSSLKQKKTVTWADDIPDFPESDEEFYPEESTKDSAEVTPPKIKIILPARRPSLPLNDTISSLPSSSPSEQTAETHEVETVEPRSPQSSASLLSEARRGTPPLSGWDSDLTDLDDLTDDDESDLSEVDTSSEPGPASAMSSGLKIRLPARSHPTPAGDSVPRCTIKKCQKVLAPDYRWKCCVTCRLHHREYQRKRQNILGRHTRLDYETESSITIPQSLPDDPLVPGARLCTIKNCTHVIPSLAEYRWKMCEPCRIRTRNNRNKLQMKKRGLAPDVRRSPVNDGTTHVQPIIIQDDSGTESEDIPLAVAVAQKHVSGLDDSSLRRCKSHDCGMIVKASSAHAECNQCISRRVQSKLQKPRRERPSSSGRVAARRLTQPSTQLAPYPEYKCLSALVAEFQSRLTGFLAAQSFYFHYKQTSAATRQSPVASSFTFDGEFSVVALDFDIVRRKDEVNRVTLDLKCELGQAAGLEFSTTHWVSFLEDGVVTRFSCVHDVQAPAEMSGHHVTAPVHMRGELEIAVLPDRSHVFFPGQRTIVRFRLVG